jgi:serine/threonine-protein kinase
MSRIVGNYALGALLGRGATSEVYAAEHRLLGDRVAVKLLRSEVADSDDAVAAFVAEAAGTRAIEHPNIVRVFDVGRDEASGSCFLVMERLEGGSLAERLRDSGPLPEAEVRRLGAAIGDGMQAAHDGGIVHRDLKPANVMMAGAEPKVVDFGIAKHLDGRSATRTQRRIGTPAYMAPEQLTGGLIAPCVDVWALGVLLFEATSGRLPFEGFEDGRAPQLFETAPRLRERAPVSPAFEALVARCLEREPGRRPQSMAELARELRAEPAADERFTDDLGPLLPAQPEPVAANGDAGGSTRSALRASRLTTNGSPGAERRASRLTTNGSPGAERRASRLTTNGSPGAERRASRLTTNGSPGAGRPTAPFLLLGLAAVGLAAVAALVLTTRACHPNPSTLSTFPHSVHPEQAEREARSASKGAHTPAPAPAPAPVPAATFASLVIQSAPSGAAIFHDGALVGITPANVSVRLPLSLTLRKDGYRDEPVRVTKAGPLSIRLTKKRKPTRPKRPRGETLD